MTLPGRRTLTYASFLACAAMMGFALYAEHVLGLAPCPLCVLQRLAVISLGLIFLVAALHDSSGAARYVYAALILLASGGGAGVAAWHVRVQNLPADQVPSCGPGLDYMLESFPLADVLKMVFTGSGECATVVWQFLGLSMPTWVLICVVLLGTTGIWNQFRKI